MTVTWIGLCSYPSVSMSTHFQGQPDRQREIHNVTLGESIQLLKTAKLAANRRLVYVNELVRLLKQITRGNENEPLSFLDASKIETFLASRNYCPAVRANVIGRISTLFEFAKRRRWILVNPCDEIEKPILEWTPPKILSPEQAEMLLRACQNHFPEALAYLVLCLFCGLRPTEARQIQWENISQKTIRVEAGVSKIRQRRIVAIRPTAALWLNAAKDKSKLPVSEGTRKGWTKRFALALGFEDGWPQDCARHTCASFWLAIKPDAGFVSMQLGNSPAILFRHYRELCSREDAKRFWSILP